MDDFEKRQDERDAHCIDQRCEDFFKRWQPAADRHERSQFAGEFFSLVQAIHREAGKPYQRVLSAAIALQPMGPFVFSQPSLKAGDK